MAWSDTLTLTTAAKFNPDVWAAIIEPQAEATLVAEGIVTSYPFEGPGDVLHIPKIGAISCSAAVLDGSDVVLTGNTETELTLTPIGREAAVFIPWPLMATLHAAAVPAYQNEIGRSIRTDKDYRILTAVASLTTNEVGGAANHVEKTVFLEGLKKIRAGNARPPYSAVFGTDEFDRFFAISDFVDASKTGSVDRIQNGLGGFLIGTSIYFTSNIYTTGGVNYNLLCGDRCIVHASKVGLTVEISQIPQKGNGTLILGKYMDISGILNDAFGCVYQTAND